MKKKQLLFICTLLLFSVLSSVAQSNVVIIDDLKTYAGNQPFVYNKKDNKTYALNNLGSYELYGVYEKVTTTKLASPSDRSLTELSAPDGAYINLNYIPQLNTQVVAVIKASDGPDWQAIYGCGYNRDGWRNRFCFFTTNATINVQGEVGNKEQMVYNEKIWTILNATDGTLKIYDDEEMTNLRGTITDAPKTEEQMCKTPLYIFAQNKDWPDSGGNHKEIDCYNSNVILYGLKIYEDGKILFDLVPWLKNGKAGLKDILTEKFYESENEKSFYLDPDELEEGITAYEGKIVYNTTDKKVYKYNGEQGKYVEVGVLTENNEVIANSDYQNLQNWTCGDDEHWRDVFAEGNNIVWNKENRTNSIPNYAGTGGWEPLYYTLNVEPGQDYVVSFKYSTSGWQTWANGGAGGGEVDEDVNLPFKIVNTINIEQNNGHYGTDAGFINGAKLSSEAQENTEITIDFNTNNGIATFIIQFGVVNDGYNGYWFKFDNFEVKAKYAYPVEYPELISIAAKLAELIDEVEAFNNAHPTEYKDYIAEGINEAKVALESNDVDKQLEAMNELQETYKQLKELLGITTPITIINANTAKKLKVYTITGQYIGTFENAEKIVVPNKGVYIVNDGEHTKKVRF